MLRNLAAQIKRAFDRSLMTGAMLFLACYPNKAADSPPPAAGPTLSLEAIVSDVLAHNPELAFYRAEIEAVRQEGGQAALLANPELSATVGNKHVVAESDTSDGPAWSASIKQTFEWPGRLGLRKAIANRQVQLAELGFERFQAALAARAQLLAFELAASEQRAAAAHEVAERFEALRETLVQRDPAGLTPALETRIIEATELTLKRKAVETSLLENSARLELNQLRGKPWEARVTVDLPRFAFSPLPEMSGLIRAAFTNNFELRLRQAELEMQGFRVALTKNERYPAISVGPYFSQERAGDRETQIGIGISIPLPIWNRNSGKIAAEGARRQQAETMLQVAYRNLERQVLEQGTAYQMRLDLMAKWRSDSVDQFKQAAALADRHYRLGAVPITTYVELQKQYLDAVEALLETRKEALEAVQSLQQLTGVNWAQIGEGKGLR